MPCLSAVASTRPTARATAAGGSSASPKVRARKNSISESVDPSISGKSAGSTAIARSRFIVAKCESTPLCIHSQFA